LPSGNQNNFYTSSINNAIKLLRLTQSLLERYFYYFDNFGALANYSSSGLHDLVYMGHVIVPHALLMTLCERWHAEISSFPLHVGEMTITLDDVTCLLHLPIEGIMMSHPKKVFQDDGVDLMVRHLGVTQAVAVKNCNEEYDAYISYKTLKEFMSTTLISLSDCQIHRLQRRYRSWEGLGFLV